MKVIIVGGVAGGATAAARIRRLDEHAEITVYERSGYISYANCGLPYYIGDVITDPEELTLQTPESFFKRFRINMKIHHEVISIHPESKTVSVKNLENGEIFEENYDKLILSPGAKPTQPRLPGVGIDKLFTLRTVEDTFRIKEYINKNHPKSAVLAGGGFIGLELAENLRELGMDVTIVQRPKQLMNPFDPDMASMIHNEMRKHGIKLVLGYTVEGFKEKDDRVEVLKKEERRTSKKYPMMMLIISVCFTLIVYAICPEKVDDPNSIAQVLALFGALFSLGSATTLWMMLLSESTNKINVEIADSGIIGATYTVVQALASTIVEILYGKKKDTDDNK